MMSERITPDVHCFLVAENREKDPKDKEATESLDAHYAKFNTDHF